jgi:hypothetical protein
MAAGSNPAILEEREPVVSVETVNLTSVHLSSVELENLQTTAVELLPAQGGRLYYVLHQVFLHYRFGTVPYTGTFSPAIGYGTVVTDIFDGAQIKNGGVEYASGWGTNVDPDHFLSLSEDAYMQAPVLANSGPPTGSVMAWVASAIENKPLIIANDPTATPVAGGDGTVSVRVFWSLIDGAP